MATPSGHYNLAAMDAWQLVLPWLTAEQLGRLAQTGRAVRDAVYASDCWRRHYEDAFGSVLYIQSIVLDAGIPVAEAQLKVAPPNWRAAFAERLEAAPPAADAVLAEYPRLQSEIETCASLSVF